MQRLTGAWFRLSAAALLAATLSLTGTAQAAETQHLTGRTAPAPHAEVATSVNGRWIVLYRDRRIPADAAERISAAGGRLLRRHLLLGAAEAQLSATEASRLRMSPGVEFLLPDRLVSGTSLPVARVATQLAAGGFRLPALSPGLTRPRPSVPGGAGGIGNAPAPLPDAYYRNTPQEWAVKLAGGYGGDVAGGPAAGPWTESTGRGVRIAILDSGVDRTHPDLAGSVVLNLSEVDQAALPSPCDDGSPQDQQGHGSWAASLAAAAAGTGTGDLVGVAPGALLLNIKVLQRMPGSGGTLEQQCAAGQASGLLSWVMQGVEDAIAQHADVISLSLGTLVDVTTADGAALKASFDRVTHTAAQAGAVVIAAAGNEGLDLSDGHFAELPAQSADVLAVVATTNPACREDLTAGATCQPGPVTLPYYSNYGTNLLAVAAPGGSYPQGSSDGVTGWIRGACSSGVPGTADGSPSTRGRSYGCFNLGHQQYVQAIGTSASAPLVAGVAALLRSAHPGWDAATVVRALRETATQVNGVPFGVVNAPAALAFQP